MRNDESNRNETRRDETGADETRLGARARPRLRVWARAEDLLIMNLMRVELTWPDRSCINMRTWARQREEQDRQSETRPGPGAR